MSAENGDTMAQSEARKFGSRLASTRAALGLSQSAIAARCGLQPSHIAHFESGRRMPSLLNLIRIRRALGCSWSALLGNDQ